LENLRRFAIIAAASARAKRVQAPEAEALKTRAAARAEAAKGQKNLRHCEVYTTIEGNSIFPDDGPL
jgi:hypothetical protein